MFKKTRVISLKKKTKIYYKIFLYFINIKTIYNGFIIAIPPFFWYYQEIYFRMNTDRQKYQQYLKKKAEEKTISFLKSVRKSQKKREEKMADKKELQKAEQEIENLSS